MGNLLQVLKAGKKGGADIFIDFEGSEPTEEERAVYDRVRAVLDKSATVLEDLSNYAGAGDPIRLAISNASNEEMQTAAWTAVCPLVSSLKAFYDYSSEVEGILPLLLEEICTSAPLESLEKKQALAKQLAEILSFVLKFDDLKMNNPAIQNDFSYYRRTLSRMKMKDPESDVAAVVNNEDANRMSLFYAYPTPMLKCVSDATTKFVKDKKDIPIENTTDCLAIMASICRIMVTESVYYDRFTNPDTAHFCQRVMTAAIILYDHVHPIGAFSKKNQGTIDMMKTLKSIKLHDNPGTESLLNALRYTTKHLNDDDAKAIKKELA